MKVFINNRDYLTWTKALTIQMAEQGHEPIIIDNGSTYPPLLEWYATSSFKIIRLTNLGSCAFWGSGLVNDQTVPFVLTDSDCDISKVPVDWPEVLLEGLERFSQHTKVGLSWDETTVPPENPWYEFFRMGANLDGSHIWHNNLLEGGWHNFPCDTSFALYRPHPPFRIDGVRKTHPYTGIHLPFHLGLTPSQHEGKYTIPVTDEIAYYFEHATPGQGWSHAAMILKEMIQQYRNGVLA